MLSRPLRPSETSRPSGLNATAYGCASELPSEAAITVITSRRLAASHTVTAARPGSRSLSSRLRRSGGRV